MKRLILPILTFQLINTLSPSALASEQSLSEQIIEPAYGLWSLAAGVKNSQFKAVDNQFSPALLIFGGYGPIFVEGNRFGYNFYRDGTYFSSLVGNVRSHSSLSKEEIETSAVLDNYQLDERKNAFEVGIQLGRRFNNGWVGRLALLQDISAKHNSQEIELSFYRRDSFKPLPNIGSIRLLTTLALQGQNKELNDYYYGVDGDEVGASGEAAYQADAGWSAELELIATYDFSWQLTSGQTGSKNWGWYAGLRHFQYSDTVSNSPIVESGLVQQYFIGLGHYF